MLTAQNGSSTVASGSRRHVEPRRDWPDKGVTRLSGTEIGSPGGGGQGHHSPIGCRPGNPLVVAMREIEGGRIGERPSRQHRGVWGFAVGRPDQSCNACAAASACGGQTPSAQLSLHRRRARSGFDRSIVGGEGRRLQRRAVVRVPLGWIGSGLDPIGNGRRHGSLQRSGNSREMGWPRKRELSQPITAPGLARETGPRSPMP
jgi:hypothetical protein